MRQDVALLGVCAAVAAGASVVRLLLAGGSHRPKLGLALVLVGALVALTGGTGFSRSGELEPGRTSAPAPRATSRRPAAR